MEIEFEQQEQQTPYIPQNNQACFNSQVNHNPIPESMNFLIDRQIPNFNTTNESNSSSADYNYEPSVDSESSENEHLVDETEEDQVEINLQEYLKVRDKL